MDNFYVNMWEEEVIIPTYETGMPEKNPMFFEKRVYQGSSGAVYPNPIIEKIYDDKKDKSYQAVFLENQFIKMMVLPQLGGRIQMAYDKIAKRHFIYYNEVIKPALVGLCGPWISGGIEFNWPQHHRPSTFEPVDFTLQENEDGSKTIWVNEIEKMHRTKGMAGFTLYPDKAYIEVNAKLFNRTPLPQTFLWWANPAVTVNDHYQSVFPPDVHAVYDHGRRDVSAFPIATGTYYKVDYSPGTDISKYKNIPVPTSYMAINSVYDFIGGYEHDTQAGMLHVSNHHVSPGKKQWTWGHGDFGQAWDRNLTDENGPYIELMTGVYTDNQPDFSWIMPYEEKTFSQYFLPYRELGIVKTANKDLALHFSINNSVGVLKLFGTSNQELHLSVHGPHKFIFNEAICLAPESIYCKEFEAPATANEEDFLIIVTNDQQQEVLRYQYQLNDEKPIPEPAKAPGTPSELTNNETLFLIGLHLEQYRHATYSPVDYYEEALRRDAGDTRNNNALGLWYLRRGKVGKSEPFFRKAIATLTQYNANPYDGEPYYNLGVCLQMQDRNEEAYEAFYKATWNSAWQANSFFALAQIDVAQKKYDAALMHLDKSLNGNAGNQKAIALKALVLRYLQQTEKAMQYCCEALQADFFNLPLYYEKSRLYKLLKNEDASTNEMEKAFALARGDVHNFIEYAVDYASAGLYEEAIKWLTYFQAKQITRANPMIWYYLGWNNDRAGNEEAARRCFEKAFSVAEDYCFPNKVEDIAVLQAALRYNTTDYKAYYFLGCLWFDKRQYSDAIEMWHRSVDINDTMPTALRNLGIAYFNKKADRLKAREYFEKAYALNTDDARILMELDQLYKRINIAPAERLSFLENYLPQVLLRDDLYLERAAIYNYLGDYETAFDLVKVRQFHPWEGGEGKVSAQYKISLVQLARKCIAQNDYYNAIDLLQSAQVYPHNLGEGKLYGTQENEIFYLLGCAYEGLQETEKSIAYYERATLGVDQPTVAIFYNDPQPDSILYQGLAWEKLGNPQKAVMIFNRLVNYGKEHLNDEVKIDFFAVSLPDLLIFDDDLNKRNTIHCKYMMALGYLGLKEYERAQTLFEEVFAADAMHSGARVHAQLIPQLTVNEAGV